MALRTRHRSHLTFCIHNATGLTGKKPELEAFITTHRVDILLLTETHLRPTQPFKLRNMVGYRTDRRNAKGGGTAIYIHKDIPHLPVTLPPLTTLEATAINISTAYGVITLISAYLSPKRRFIEADFTSIFAAFPKILLCGDLNAKHYAWNSRRTNPRGNLLYALENRLEALTLGPEDPTHIPPNPRHAPDVLDIAIQKNLRLDLQLTTIVDLDSHHNPVLGIIREAAAPFPSPTSTVTNWDHYSHWLQNNVRPTEDLSTIPDIDLAVSTFTSKLQKAYHRASVRSTHEPRPTEPFSPLLQDIKTLKNRARKRWLRFRNPADRQEMKRLARELHFRAIEHRQEVWEDKMDSLMLNSRSEWQLVRSIRQPRPPKLAIRGPDGHIYDPLGKAEAFAATYEAQNTLDLDDDDPSVQRTRQAALHIRYNLRPTDPELTTPAEVRHIITQLGTHSAPGADGITNSHLKHLPRKPIVLLTRIFNSCFIHGYFPSAWKIARVVPIPKPGKDHSVPSNYRPISLLSTLSKVFERLILRRIKGPILDNDIIRPDQFAFQPALSAELQLLRVTEFLTSNMNRKYYTAAVFLDVEKAFDRVWKDRLLVKLHNLHLLPSYCVQLIDSFLQDRRLLVKIDGHRSSLRPLMEGIPQGSVLSPLLFVVYVNDIPTRQQVVLAQFADDTALLATSCRVNTAIARMQQQLRLVERWAKDNAIRVNADKTTAIMFTRRRPDLRDRLRLHDKELPWSTSIKYLGVWFDNKLLFHRHVEQKRIQLLRLINQLFPFLASSNLNVATKHRLFKATILQSLLYGSSAWGVISRTGIRPLQVQQNRCLRLILGAPRWARIVDLHAELDQPTVQEAIIDHTARLLHKIDALRPTTRHLENVGLIAPRNWHKIRVPRAIIEVAQ